jgi:hypothetical protein
MTTVFDVVQNICLSFPETEEIVSHGFPTFKAQRKTFATYSLNHHGDGKVALILNMSRDIQKILVESAPKHFYVPPYTGVKGWVGIELNQGLSWDRIAQLTCDSYRKVVSAKLSDAAGPPKVGPPTQSMRPEDIDPYVSKNNQKLLKALGEISLDLPETSTGAQFGAPCFKAGKKTFCNLHQWQGHTELQAWVGADRQAALTSLDARYRVPAYSGPNGWISFDLSGSPSWREVKALVRESYRHFALKRMLKALNE